MGKPRKAIQREILDLLDRTAFTSDDFVVSFGEPTDEGFLVCISFKHDRTYTYSINWYNPLGVAQMYRVTMRPGDIEEEESKSFKTLKEAISPIPSWCTEIRNELKAEHPTYREIDELRQLIHRHIVSQQNGSEEFSAQEIDALRHKFRELEERVVKLEEARVITEKQLAEFKGGIEQVTEDLEYYPRSTWIKTATNKPANIVAAIGRSKEGRQLLADGARKLLGLD
jgi:hypothetical protein